MRQVWGLGVQQSEYCHEPVPTADRRGESGRACVLGYCQPWSDLAASFYRWRCWSPAKWFVLALASYSVMEPGPVSRTTYLHYKRAGGIKSLCFCSPIKQPMQTSLMVQCLSARSQCRGHGFSPWLEKIPHVMWYSPPKDQINKKNQPLPSGSNSLLYPRGCPGI